MTKKPTILFIFFCILFEIVYSQNNAVQFDKNCFNIDITKKLILINQDVEQLNSLFTEPKESFISNEINYSFITPVTEFETGKAYKVIDNNNEYYDLYFTELPVINIFTENTIVDEPRVYAYFSISESNGNYIENAIGIEFRGGSTQYFPKKSFRIEFWNDSLGNETEDICLLGMRSDDDWNLQAMYNEPLRIRSKVNYDLWKSIDALYYSEDEPEAINGVNQEFIELFLNNEYKGVFALSERVDRKQLKLKKYKDGEIRGELYKGVGWGASTFTYLPYYNNNSELWSGLQYEYPDEEINWSNIYELVNFVINEDSLTFYETYENEFNIDNAVNYFIFLNLLRATDNTGKNIFIAKYNHDEPYFYVPWDLDGTFGIIWNGTKEDITNDIFLNGLYERLILDDRENGFLEKLKNRWNELRINTITLTSIIEAFNEQFQYLKSNGVYEREVKAWPACMYYDENNMDYTIEWIEKRLNYLDKVFNDPSLITTISEHKLGNETGIKIYPNPASNFVYFNTSENNSVVERITMYNMAGGAVVINCTSENKGMLDVSKLENGVYLVAAELKNGYKKVEKLLIKRN